MTAPAPHLPATVGVLTPYVSAGIFGPTEIQLAATVARLQPDVDPLVLLALAVGSRGPRLGHVGIELAEVPTRMLDRDQEDLAALGWPDATDWALALHASPLVAAPSNHTTEPLRPLVWDGTRIYLQRYFAYELLVADDVRQRATADRGGGGDPRPETAAARDAALDVLFPPDPGGGPDLQREAARVALTHRLAVIAGGPGTGKTHTVARLLAAAHQVAALEGRRLEVALAAPTGKAAARMTEAVRAAVARAEQDDVVEPELAERLRSAEAITIHRLLGWRPGSRFRHHRLDPLPHDLVIIDETSMVSLPLMARLLQAVRPEARLVLVGDPDQLASVDAGTVLSDLVGPSRGQVGVATTTVTSAADPLVGRVTVLERGRRFAAGSGIAALADAVRRGDADSALALLDGSRDDLRWVRTDDPAGLARLEQTVIDVAVAVMEAALGGDPARGLRAATDLKVLSATRRGPNGLRDWSDRIERAVAARIPALEHRPRWYAGRPVLVTANDRLNGLANGDTGLTVAQGDGFAVAFPDGAGIRLLAASRLREVETWWAMTIHKSQGSEFPHVVVALPAAPSPILTRELLYTAVTRGKERITLVADEAAIRAAVGQPVARASGLRGRLWTVPAP